MHFEIPFVHPTHNNQIKKEPGLRPVPIIQSVTCINIMNFYSVRIAVVCIVEGVDDLEDGYTQDIQVHILKAKDQKSAFDQAIKIGLEQETGYLNQFKQKVVWKFRKVEDVRCLGSDIVNCEASSRMEGFFSEEPLTIESEFHPEESNAGLL